MLRIEVIKKHIEDFCENVTIHDIKENPTLGISSLDIVERLSILRNNASSDLNKLYKDGLLIKIKGKPTKYFYREHFENIFQILLDDECLECSSLADLVPILDSSNEKEVNNTNNHQYFILMDFILYFLESLVLVKVYLLKSCMSMVYKIMCLAKTPLL